MVGGRGQPRRRQPGLLPVPLRQRQAVAGAFVDDDGRWHLRLHLALAAQGRPVMTVITGRALITGGSAGIGYAFAHALARRGVDLVLVSRTESRLDEAARELREHGVEVEILAADLATDAGVETVEARIGADPQINILGTGEGRGGEGE